MRQSLTAIAALLALSACAAAPARAQTQDTVFDVELVFQMDRIRPTPLTGLTSRHSITLTLTGKNTVRFERRRAAGRARSSDAASTTLGDESARGAWRVINANTLQGAYNSPNSTRVTTLTTTGGNSCSVQVVDRLKPGARDYVFKRVGGGMGTYTQPRLVSSSCAVR